MEKQQIIQEITSIGTPSPQECHLGCAQLKQMSHSTMLPCCGAFTAPNNILSNYFFFSAASSLYLYKPVSLTAIFPASRTLPNTGRQVLSPCLVNGWMMKCHTTLLNEARFWPHVIRDKFQIAQGCQLKIIKLIENIQKYLYNLRVQKAFHSTIPKPNKERES